MNVSAHGLSSGVAAVLVIVALVVGLGAGYFVGGASVPPVTTTITQRETTTVTTTETKTVEMEMGMQEEMLSSIIVGNQVVEDDTITIKLVYLDKPGYVAIHQVTLDGKPGPVIGNSDLLQAGLSMDVKIEIANYQGRGELIAMLHYDDGDGEYNFPGPDKPVIKDGTIIQTIFKITNKVPSIAVSNQEINDNKIIIIDGLFLDKPGYVAIHKVTPEGKPGPVIGNSGLLVGQLVRVPVPVPGYEGDEELIAMLHYDDGDAVYNFPGPDGPVMVDGKVVLVKFKVESMAM